MKKHYTLNDVEGAGAPRFSNLQRLNDILPLEDFIKASDEPIEEDWAGAKTTMTLPQTWCGRWWLLNFRFLEGRGKPVTLWRLPDKKPLKIRPLQLYDLTRVMAVLPDFSETLAYEIGGEYYRGPEPGAVLATEWPVGAKTR